MRMSAIVLLTLTLGAAGVAHAQQSAPPPRADPEKRAAAQEKWRNATPEQREAWKAANPDAAKRAQERGQTREERRSAAGEKWKNATPEEREAWKARNPDAAKRLQERRQGRQPASP